MKLEDVDGGETREWKSKKGKSKRIQICKVYKYFSESQLDQWDTDVTLIDLDDNPTLWPQDGNLLGSSYQCPSFTLWPM